MSLLDQVVTLEQVLSWYPCWSEDAIKSLVGDRTSMTIGEIIQLDISAEDKLWLLLREQFLPKPLLRNFAADCAERALLAQRETGNEPDPRSWNAISVARKYAAGQATDEDLAAARDAAYAAWHASRAAYAAAWPVAVAAAYVAAGDAAAGDACAAERKWQLEHLLGMLSSD